MPTRILRDGILDSRAVNALSEQAEILYRRLMSIVDDYGRYEADPDLLRIKCFGMQMERWPVARVKEALTELRMKPDVSEDTDPHPLVSVYSSGRKKYLQINNFGQRLQSKPKYPEPPAEIEYPENPRGTTVIHRENGDSPSSRSRVEVGVESDTKSESGARAESQRTGKAEPIPISTGIPRDLEDRARKLAGAAVDTQDYESGVQMIIEAVKSSVDPERCLRIIEENVPLWFAAMARGDARVKTLRYLFIDKDYMRKPREPTVRNQKTAWDQQRDRINQNPNPRLTPRA